LSLYLGNLLWGGLLAIGKLEIDTAHGSALGRGRSGHCGDVTSRYAGGKDGGNVEVGTFVLYAVDEF
jgi:hypothetical protein